MLVACPEAVVQSLLCESTLGKKISLGSVGGLGPGNDTALWQGLFSSAQI